MKLKRPYPWNARFGRRKLLRGTLGVGGALLATGREKSASATSSAWLYAYPHKMSVRQGTTLELHYLTNQQKFRVLVFRQGTSLSPVWSSDWFTVTPDTGAIRPLNSSSDATKDWAWPSVEISIPSSWTPGVYVLMFEAATSDGIITVGSTAGTYSTSSPWATSAQALVVVRRASGSATPVAMFKVPVMTYHAYNATCGASVYPSPSGLPSQILGIAPDGSGGAHTGYRSTLLRPGGGTGGDMAIGGDPLDGSSPYCTFAHWDAKMISWLEANRYPAGTLDYCTDIDLHSDPQLLSGTRLLISAGHDEYWSSAMRDQLEAFIARGGNVAFFSGNTCFWRIYCADDDGDGVVDAFVCDKRLPDGTYSGPLAGSDGADIWWRQRPENTLTGVSTRNAGYSYPDSTGPGYTIQLSSEWIFANAGLSDGAVLGGTDHLVNYEADGAAYTTGSSPLVPALTDLTPATFRILGYAQLGSGWVQPPREGPSTSAHAATMGYFSRIGTVFNGGTTDWARVLTDGNSAVRQITTNVLQGLDSPRAVQCAGDCNGDGYADIVLRHPTSGAVSFWYGSSGGISSSRYSDYHYQQVAGWTLTAVGDLNGDGGVDYVWYNPTTGQIVFWYTDGTNVNSGAYVSRSQDPAWTLVSAADFDQDGHCDLIFQNRTSGQMAVWYLNNTTVLGGAYVTPNQDPAYILICAADLNQDGKPDLLFHNRTTGQATMWQMTSGVAFTVGFFLSATTGAGWNIVAAGKFGIGGASTAQVLLQNTQSMALKVWTLASDGHTVISQTDLAEMP